MHLKYGAAKTSSFTIYEDFLRQATCVTVVLHYGAANCVSVWCILASRSRPLPMSCHSEYNVLYYRSIYCATRQTLMDLAIVCPVSHWNIGQLVFSIGRDRRRHFLLRPGGSQWRPMVVKPPCICLVTSSAGCFFFYFRIPESSSLPSWLVLVSGDAVHVLWIFAWRNTLRRSFMSIRDRDKRFWGSEPVASNWPKICQKVRIILKPRVVSDCKLKNYFADDHGV